MHVKSTILIGLTIVSLASARAVPTRTEEDNNNNNNNDNSSNNNNEEEEEMIVSDAESAPDPVIAITPSSVQECALAANAQTERTLGNTDLKGLTNTVRAMFDRMDENKRTNLGRRTNLDRIRNGIMARASSSPGNSILQILDDLDLLRPGENQNGVISSIISNIIDPLIMPPQMQYVDNTLRLMAIKNTMDDLLAKVFPNLHMIQHPTEQHNNN